MWIAVEAISPVGSSRYDRGIPGESGMVRRSVTVVAMLARIPRWLAELAGRHRLFSVMLAAGLVLRVMAWLAYQPVLFLSGDSYSYVSSGLGRPNPIRPLGYPLLLHSLLWVHTLAVVPAVQHLFGLATAVLVYALLRRLGAGRSWPPCAPRHCSSMAS